MFNNAFQYNDEASEVYQDAATLKALLLQYLGKGPGPISASSASVPKLGDVTLIDEIEGTGGKYGIGDYVYIESADPNTKSTIVQLVELWRDNISYERLLIQIKNGIHRMLVSTSWADSAQGYA